MSTSAILKALRKSIEGVSKQHARACMPGSHMCSTAKPTRIETSKARPCDVSMFAVFAVFPCQGHKRHTAAHSDTEISQGQSLCSPELKGDPTAWANGVNLSCADLRHKDT